MTLIPVSSSWIVEDGFARRLGEERGTLTGRYRCGNCQGQGHSIRTCPELDGLRRSIAGKRFR